ncbi:serine hydrolase domain-containing protein [Pseudooctadecabacter sp.]|uniref:serine hydrolase domain-containing protein n=1 Tax=Pseudooctadecabacter sp. TaxID=1966338 RepID=UPI003F6D540A
MIAVLDKLARSVQQSGPFAFCGVGVSRGGPPAFATACADGVTADEKTLFRVASVSKIVTAAAFEVAAGAAGLDRPYAVDAGEILGLDLRHPQFPDTAVTLGMLMTHTSGLSDAHGYGFDGTLAEGWTAATAFGPHAPGSFFEYSNLGYILLAAAAEVVSGQRFDLLVADVLSPHGIEAGFNWAGLTDAPSVPTFRRDGPEFVAMIDAPPDEARIGESYILGQHTARFSPQGGLRMSLQGMLTLAIAGAGVARRPLWRQTDGPGVYENGLFQDYGAGEQILPDPPFYPRPLVGHFGNAYGFNGGVWWDAEADLCFAYALNGVPMGEESDALSTAELAIFEAVAQLP